MFCNYCGAPNPDDASFCSTCGKASARSSAKVAAQQEPSPNLEPTSSQVAAPVAATERENVESSEIRFEKRRVNKLSGVGCGLVLVFIAFVAFGLILSPGIIVKIVGVVVLIFCLIYAGVIVYGFAQGNDPLEIGDNYVAFAGKKIYARDVVRLEVKDEKIRDGVYLLYVSTTHGKDRINLLDYGIKPDRVGEVADIIAETLKTSLKPWKD